MSILLLFKDKIYAARDKFGRTPVVIGKKRDAYCATFESSAFLNLGYRHVCDLGPGEIVSFTYDSLKKEKETQSFCISFIFYYSKVIVPSVQTTLDTPASQALAFSIVFHSAIVPL